MRTAVCRCGLAGIWLLMCAAAMGAPMLEVESQPAGAEVWVNGERCAVTPARINGLPLFPDRINQVELHLTGHVPARVAADYAKASSYKLNIVLTPAVPVALYSDPPGASVSGDLGGLTTPVQLRAVSAGRRRVMVSREGHLTQEATLTLARGSDNSFLFRLQPASGLTVASHPARAQVIINNQLMGLTPLDLDQLPPGPQDIRLVHEPWHGSQRRGLTLAPFSSASLWVDLPPSDHFIQVRRRTLWSLGLGLSLLALAGGVAAEVVADGHFRAAEDHYAQYAAAASPEEALAAWNNYRHFRHLGHQASLWGFILRIDGALAVGLTGWGLRVNW